MIRTPAHLQAELSAWLPSRAYQYLRQAGEVAAEKGYSLYLIGGCVRDLLLNRPFDWDLDLVSETYGVERLASLLQQRWGGLLQSFERYGTAKLRLEQAGEPTLELDFATARTEHYAHHGANPEVSFSTLEADLIRRDFSVNAMAIALLPHQFGALIDPFGGWQDLQDKRLRALHELKFLEDPVRCWRAARMSQMLGFSLDEQTRQWVLEAMQSGSFDYFFTARMRRELDKIFAKSEPVVYFERLQELKVWRCLDPQLDFLGLLQFIQQMSAEQALFTSITSTEFVEHNADCKKAQKAQQPDLETVYLLGLLLNMASAAHERQLNVLELSKAQLAAWQALSDLDQQNWPEQPSLAVQRLQGLPAEALWACLAAEPEPAVAAAIRTYWQTWRLIRSHVSGTIIKEWIPPGPHIRRILQTILFARLDGLIETPEQELSLARQLADEVGKHASEQ